MQDLQFSPHLLYLLLPWFFPFLLWYFFGSSWAGIAVQVKRLHDRDKSGWWVMLDFLILPAFWNFFALGIRKGTYGRNRFGPDPLETELWKQDMETHQTGYKWFIFRSIFVSLFVLFFVVPMGRFTFKDKKASSQVVQQEVVFTTLDNRSQITVPVGWENISDQNENAKLTLRRNSWFEELMIVIYTQNKVDAINRGLKQLSDYAPAAVNLVVSKATGAKVSEPIPMEIDGHPALQYEVRCVIDDVSMEIIHTSVAGSNHFHVLAALASKRDSKEMLDENVKEELHTIIKSFRLLNGGIK